MPRLMVRYEALLFEPQTASNDGPLICASFSRLGTRSRLQTFRFGDDDGEFKRTRARLLRLSTTLWILLVSRLVYDTLFKIQYGIHQIAALGRAQAATDARKSLRLRNTAASRAKSRNERERERESEREREKTRAGRRRKGVRFEDFVERSRVSSNSPREPRRAIRLDKKKQSTEYLSFDRQVAVRTVSWRQVGGRLKTGADFDPIAEPAKKGKSHGNGVSRAAALQRYASEATRYALLDARDLAYFQTAADPRLVAAFHYFASDERRAAAAPDADQRRAESNCGVAAAAPGRAKTARAKRR